MKLGVLLSFCLSFSLAPAHDGVKKNEYADQQIRQLFSAYEKALIAHDVKFPEKAFISSLEYKKILELVKKKQPNCVGSDEERFDSEMNVRTYRELITSKAVINKMAVSRIDYFSSCGNLLTVPRVVCTIRYAGNKIVEVPFLVVKTLNNEYKILRNFLDYKLVANGQ